MDRKLRASFLDEKRQAAFSRAKQINQELESLSMKSYRSSVQENRTPKKVSTPTSSQKRTVHRVRSVKEVDVLDKLEDITHKLERGFERS